jgi:conjugative transposon TraN protein
MLYFIKHNCLELLMGSILALCTIEVEAQGANTSQRIEVTFNKTSSLVFPAVIKSVDRGSRDVLAQKAKGVENVLQLKAARAGFAETNLTVITADGTIHHFTVNYAKEPEALIWNGGKDNEGEAPDKRKLIFQTTLTESDLETYASQIVRSKRSVRFARESRNKMTLSLNGIYIRDNIIFYHFRMRNASNINYDIDFLRFYVQDKVKVKRTASQEVDKKPLYVYGDQEHVPANTTQDVVYALEKFTIPDAKRLYVEMFEHNGGRNLELSIRNKTIVKAKLIQ